MEAMKKCCACGEDKSFSEFYSRANRRPNRTTERTYSHRCKVCDRAATRATNARYANDADFKVLPVEKQCAHCQLVKPAAAFALNRSKKDGLQSICYVCHRDKRYGLEPGQFDRLMAEQDGTCAICRQPCPRQFELSVDHCHVTGRVRGLLCQNCNAALGMFKDEPALRARAIDYLKAVADHA